MLFFAVTLAVITYVDRVCISQAAPAMQSELGLTKIQMGYAFTAFGWAYALFEIPGGHRVRLMLASAGEWACACGSVYQLERLRIESMPAFSAVF